MGATDYIFTDFATMHIHIYIIHIFDSSSCACLIHLCKLNISIDLFKKKGTSIECFSLTKSLHIFYAPNNIPTFQRHKSLPHVKQYVFIHFMNNSKAYSATITLDTFTSIHLAKYTTVWKIYDLENRNEWRIHFSILHSISYSNIHMNSNV